MGNTIATPPQFHRAEKTPADYADHEFSKNQKMMRKKSDDYNNSDDDARKRINMSTERSKKRKRVYSNSNSNSNSNNNIIKPRKGIKLIPRPKLEEFVDNNLGSEKSELIQQLRETFNLDLRQAHNQYYNHIKPILASLDKSSHELQDDVLESPKVPSEWRDDDDDDVIKESTSKKKSKISEFGHEIGQLVETDMTIMVAPEKKQCRSEGCTKYKKSSYHDGYCLSCYREHYHGSDATTSITESSSSSNSSGIGNLPIPLNKKHYGSDATPNSTESSSSNSSNNHPIQTMATTTTGDGGPPKSSKYCIFDGCMKHKQKGCFGYCLTHKAYANPEQHRLENELAAAESAMKKSTMPPSNFCKFEGCDKYKQANCNGYCLQHVKSNVAYEDDDLVRVRCDTGLHNGFCVAILSDENRAKLGLERPPPMSCDEEDDDDEVDEEMDQEEDTSPAAESGVGNKKIGQPEFKISNQIQRKENGALLCKAVGCPKIAQTKHDGFCRNHFNRFIISTGQCESWECKCGEKIAVMSLRCGVCHRWKDGHHPAYNTSAQKNPGVTVSSPVAMTASLPKTYVPEDANVQISDVTLKNDRGRVLCKVIGCGKAEQAQNDGFCRTHFNEFAITDGMDEDMSEKWTCKCGNEWSVRQKRCGNTRCQKWQGGKREAYTMNRASSTIEEGKWTCDNCGGEVEMRKSRCGTCHRWKGGKRQVGTLRSASNYGSDDGGIDRTQDWTCDNCQNGEIIAASQVRCGKCNRWRGGKRKPAPWECTQCNLSNPGGRNRCSGCLAWKARTKLPAKVSKMPLSAEVPVVHIAPPQQPPPSEASEREIKQHDVPEEHTTGDNNNGSTEVNVVAIKTEYEADTDDDTPTVTKTDRKDLTVKIKSEYEADTDDDADAKVDGIKISQGKLSPRRKRLDTSEGAEIDVSSHGVCSQITTMVNRDNSRKKATPAKKSSGSGAKKKIKDDTQILMTQRMIPFGREVTSRQGATALMKRCMRTHGWNEMKTRKVLNAYHQFITLKKEHEDWDAKILSPCYLVDQMWHSHILDVVNYCHDMMLLCGRVVGHDPDGALDYVAKQQRDERTREALQERFGSYDEDVWDYSPDETHGKSEEEEGAKGSEPISIILKDQTGKETNFIMKRNTKMNEVFEAYVDRKGSPRKRMFYFLLKGERIDGCLTPEELELKDGDQIDVILEQSGC